MTAEIKITKASEEHQPFIQQCIDDSPLGALPCFDGTVWELHNPEVALYVLIGYVGPDPVGFVFFDTIYETLSDSTTSVSICVAESQRGKGLGTALLQAAIAEVKDAEAPFMVVRAHAKEGNVGSQKVLEAAGFQKVSEIGGTVDYTYPWP